MNKPVRQRLPTWTAKCSVGVALIVSGCSSSPSTLPDGQRAFDASSPPPDAAVLVDAIVQHPVDAEAISVIDSGNGKDVDAAASIDAATIDATPPPDAGPQFGWSQVITANAPTPRSDTAMAYDSLNKVGILFGGSTTTGSVGDTWQWDGSNWTELTPTTSPPNTFAQSMTYDSAHQQIIMFGGFASNQTWLWDGTNWNLPSITGDSPSQRTFASLAFDETTQTSVLFGGSDSNGTFFNDTWEWDGTQWTLDTPATSPSARNGAAITYDPALHVVLLQGGNNAQGQLSDTWQWDGSTWTMLSVSGAPASQYPQMVYDALLGQEVLFAIFTGTFTYDGTSWNSSSLPSVLAGTSFEAMMYDDDKQEAIVFGGNASAGQSNQTWAYGPQP